MSRRALWQSLYERFDPELPARGAWRADRPHTPAKRIIDSLAMPFGDPRILLTGTVGTGKTTELLRIAETQDQKELVVFLDLYRHFAEVVRDSPALDRISSWEVCFLASLAMVGTAKEKLGYEFPQTYLEDLERAWRKLAKATNTPEVQVDIGAMAKTLAGLAAPAVGAVLAGPPGAAVGASLSVSGGVAGALKNWVLPLGRSSRFLPDQDADMQTLLACVNVLIGEFQHKSRRVLFVIDGLDRIRNIERAKELFVDSQLISQLACRVIICAPFALRHHIATPAVRGFEPVVLVNEPVLDHKNPQRHGEGVGFFCDLFVRRTADMEGPPLIERSLLEELAYRSGGRARDFVRFIRELAKVAWQADVEVASADIVRRVIDEQRRIRETGIHRGHIELLEEIANDPEHRLPANPLAQELLNFQHLLPYPNESEWYYPHPLLTMHLVRPKPPGSAG
ncbi:MAG TPA: hypothetical protein VK447_13280 [Myxococcaceae bacterium]|nr:hypothetical protein [Myxococcaceae bacterium]